MRRIVSWMILALLLVGTFTLAFRIQLAMADKTKYINADGNINGSIDAKKDSVSGNLSPASSGQQPSLTNGNAVANVTSFETIRWQEKTFYAAGRYWLFYVDGGYPTETTLPSSTVYYTTSTDGVSWTPPATLASGLGENSGENLQAFLSNSGYLQVFYRSNQEIYYRMGTPNSDGSITWATPDWQVVFNAMGERGTSTVDFYATTDSNNCPWVSWGYVQESVVMIINASDIKMYVWKDAFDNGTWQTASGFPYNVGTGNYTNDFMVPLSNGRIYVMYFLDNPPLSGQIFGELWNGTSWGPQETCTTSQVNEQYVGGYESYDRTAVADSNDDIFLAFLSTALNLVFVERTMSGGWSSETIVQSNCGDYSSPSFNLYNGQTRLFWINNATTICNKEYVNGVWDVNPTVIVNETNSEIAVGACEFGTDDGRLNSFTMTLGGKIGLLWVNNQTATDTGQIMLGLFQPPTGPTYSNIGVDSTAANSPCTFSCYWTDTEGLSRFIFSTNNTGNWQNDSALGLSGTAAWANVTKTLNPTVGAVVGYEWFANNTYGNWATTGIQTLIIGAPFHDVAATNVASSKTVVCQGYCMNVTITAADLGTYRETFNLTVYANATYITSQNVTLSSGTSGNVTFTWNTTGFGYGNCTISAYAWPVPGETNTANNNFTGGWVVVSIPGDVWGSNHLPDGKVDMKDIAYIAANYGTTSTSPNWHANADIINDGRIDMKDIAIAAANFGKRIS